MASVWKHPLSKFWYARFTNAAGIQQNRSTKTTDRRTAERIANTFEDAHRMRQTETQIHRVMSDINRQLNGQALPTQTVKDYFIEWSKTATTETSPRTGEKYEAVGKEFVTWLGKRAEDHLFRITTADITRWRDSLLANNSSLTARGKLKIIKVAFKRAWRMGILTDDPAVKVPSPKVSDESPRRPFTKGELEILFSTADNTWRGFILFGLYTGQRLRDICLLKWDSIAFKKGRCEIRLVTSKTGRHQVLPSPPPLTRWLSENKQDAGPVFPDFYHTATKAKNTGSVSLKFGALLAQAGLIEAKPKSHASRGIGRRGKRKTGELTFHSLRHTATSMLKELGVSDAVVMDIIGHDSKAISRNYTHISDASKEEAMAKLPDITRP